MRYRWLSWSLGIVACGGTEPPGAGGGTADDGVGFTEGSSAPGSDEGTDTGSLDDDDGGTPKLDVGSAEGGGEDPDGPVESCTVVDDMNAVGECEAQAPPEAFEPDVQWSWTGPDGEENSIVTPLVANMTDDNDDGAIDLCDIPDVVVLAAVTHLGAGHIYVLDGETGVEHFRIERDLVDHVAPAVGDIDGDGLVEIVAVAFEPDQGHIVAFEHDGTPKWTSDAKWDDANASSGAYYGDWAYGSIALADLDNDADVEIIAGNLVFDHTGKKLWAANEPAGDWNASTAADLDGDGDLEVVLGHAAFHHTGERAWKANIGPGFPQVADLDGDGLPEVLVTNHAGFSILEHDGKVKYADKRPTGVDPVGLNWIRPATIHDFDGDGAPEFAVSSATHYTVYEADGSIAWDASVVDNSGVAAGTAFDFLGDGVAEAMYADEQELYIYGDSGSVLLQQARGSVTGTEYPVVADIDDDGSAEILVVSNTNYYGSMEKAPTIQAIRDIDDRWIQARRIWNQHAYHVTNVREDGTIPQFEPPSWQDLNTFRTNAQIEGGSVCTPPPPG